MHIATRLSERGGADQFLLGLMEELSTQHEQVLVVGKVDPDTTSPCPVHVVPGLDSSGIHDEIVNLTRLNELITKYEPDLLHIHNLMHPDILTWASQHTSLLTIQDHRYFCPGRGKWTLANEPCTEVMTEDRCRKCFSDSAYFETIMKLTRSRLAVAKRFTIHVLSNYMRTQLVQAGCDPRKIHVLAPFVRQHRGNPRLPAKRPPKPNGQYALFLGRLVKAKGVWDATQAWRRSGVDMPLVFVGTGPERQMLVSNGFNVLGWQNRQEVQSLLDQASVLIFCPRWQEPFGIVGIEALSHGTSVAAWQSGAIVEWYGQDRLAPWGDVDSLAEKIYAMCDKTPRAPVGFDVEKTISGINAIYKIAMKA